MTPRKTSSRIVPPARTPSGIPGFDEIAGS